MNVLASIRLMEAIRLIDSLIAANALQNNLIIATRDGSDFLHYRVQIINPWE